MKEALSAAIYYYAFFNQILWGITLLLGLWAAVDLLRGQTKEPKINDK